MVNYSFVGVTLDDIGRLVDNLSSPKKRYRSKLVQILLGVFSFQETGNQAPARVPGSFLGKGIYAFSWGGSPTLG
jgi:hypothetical protein